MANKPTYEELEKQVLGLKQEVDKYRSAFVKYQTLFHEFPSGITLSDSIMANYEDYGFCAVIPKPYTGSQMADLLNKIFKDDKESTNQGK